MINATPLLLAHFLQLVPITMELVAPIKSQRLYYYSQTEMVYEKLA